MRAYKKTTQHPYCIYLTEVEAADLIEESQGVDPDLTPHWARLVDRLSSVVSEKP